MAFARTVSYSTVFGNKRIVVGEFSQGNTDTGGDIDTTLSAISFFHASYSTDNSDSSGTVTIVTADPGGAQVGHWMAIGE
ncbi:MAG: hypothetical protein GY820_38940 [Gammaproteobacteria bacterium]|nr:hypothetical protein [Gammaproteobacteria bacterium]